MAILSEERLRAIRTAASYDVLIDSQYTRDLLAAYDEALKERERLREALLRVPCTCGNKIYKMGHDEHYHDCAKEQARAALAEKSR